MNWKKWIKNTGAIALAPATGGLSLGLVEDNAGNSILDNITGAKSAREQEQRQKQYQDATNNLSIELANTAHQREVQDLQNAGLNPVLSAGGSGATTPTLGTATAVNEMPGGYLSQAGQAAQILNMAGTAKQAISQANLNDVNAEIQPEIAKADITAKFAEAGSAKATADYTKTMKDIDKKLKQTQTSKTNAEAYEKHRENKFNKQSGIFKNMSGIEKFGRAFGGGLANTARRINY